VVKGDLKNSLRKKLPDLSRELIEKAIEGFKNDKIARKEFMIYFGIKNADAKKGIGN
jgi:hypothetical protein